MERITREPDGSYHWECSIDKDFHRKAGKQGLWGILIVCAVVMLVFLLSSRGTDSQNSLWIPLLVIGVVLVIALPLFYLWNNADDPHEQYVLTEDYVKSGYGRASIYSEFKKTDEVVVTSKYIEMVGKYRNNRVYVPAEDMDFVREYIRERLPEDAVIKQGTA